MAAASATAGTPTFRRHSSERIDAIAIEVPRAKKI
jgi:hypothetical protein